MVCGMLGAMNYILSDDGYNLTDSNAYSSSSPPADAAIAVVLHIDSYGFCTVSNCVWHHI